MESSGTVEPGDVVAAAMLAEAGLRPVVGRDWSVRAGTLNWDVEQTVAHMLGAVAKYTLYLASRCDHFIALSVTHWPDATHEEIVDSIVPVAAGLASVAATTPPDVRVFHATGPSTATDYIARACVELLVHAEDALSGLAVPFGPPEDICHRVLAQQFPDAAHSGDPWGVLLRANNRPIR